MLMQSFKSADDLQIPERHRQALMKTLVLFETGKIAHVSLWDQSDFRRKRSQRLFNMTAWRAVEECGSVCCIGGTAEAVGRVNFSKVDLSDALGELFSPSTHIPYNLITIEQAAMGLRNYLTTGDASWGDILEPETASA